MRPSLGPAQPRRGGGHGPRVATARCHGALFSPPPPRWAAGYRAEETTQVVAACLTLAGALGDLSNKLCIVGGLVPSMICDTRVDPSALDD